MNREIAELDGMGALLARASSIEQIKTLRDTAEALRTYAQAARLGIEVCNRAAELRLMAERKAGRMHSSWRD